MHIALFHHIWGRVYLDFVFNCKVFTPIAYVLLGVHFLVSNHA